MKYKKKCILLYLSVGTYIEVRYDNNEFNYSVN